VTDDVPFFTQIPVIWRSRNSLAPRAIAYIDTSIKKALSQIAANHSTYSAFIESNRFLHVSSAAGRRRLILLVVIIPVMGKEFELILSQDKALIQPAIYMEFSVMRIHYFMRCAHLTRRVPYTIHL
jgi:hypothetical protein